MQYGREIEMVNGPMDGEKCWTADHVKHLDAEYFTSDIGRQHLYVLDRNVNRWVHECVQAEKCRGK